MMFAGQLLSRNILWLPFGAAYNLSHGVLAVYFVYAILGGKGIAAFLKPKHLAFVVAYALTMSVENIVFSDLLCRYNIVFSPVFMLILASYGVIVFKTKLKRSLWLSLMSNMIIFQCLYVCNDMTTYLFGNDVRVLFEAATGDQLIAIISSPMLVFYIMFIILRMSRKIDLDNQSSLRLWALVSVVLIISDVVIVEQFVGFGVVYYRPTLYKYLRFSLIYTALTGIVVYWLLSDLVKKNKAVNELALLRQIEEYNRRYIESLQSEFETVRKLRHDHRNSFLALAELLDKGELQKAKEQIAENLGATAETEIFINTDNAVVNAVANAKLSAAKSLGIECECLVVKDISGISDLDLCRLLSNMLDNAIAASRVEPDDRRISLIIRNEGDGYSIIVKNAVSRSVLETNPELKSTKPRHAGHGYGVRIIREIAVSRDGRSDFYEEDGMFVCAVWLRKGSGTSDEEK